MKTMMTAMQMRDGSDVLAARARRLNRVLCGAALALLVGGVGCSGSSDPNANHTTHGETAGACTAVEVEGEDYCVWRKQSIIIETGYVCPQMQVNRHDVSGLVVCSGSVTPPTPERVVLIEEEFERVTQMMPMPDLEMGMPALTCEDYAMSYGVHLNGLPRVCQQDSDCGEPYITDNLLTSGLATCTTAFATGADTGTLTQLSLEYRSRGCLSDIREEGGCAEAVSFCDEGQCAARPAAGPAPVCEDLTTDFLAAVDALDQSCQAASDCVRFAPNCTIGGGNCELAIATSADTSGLDAIAADFAAQSCNANGPVCAACWPAGVDCQQGQCVVVERVEGPSCEMIKSDYSAAVDTLPTSCQQDADCQLVGSLDCGCPTAVSASADLSALAPSEMAYTSARCERLEPICSLCRVDAFCDSGECATRPEE